MYSYIVRQRGSPGSGLSAADYAAGVRDIVDLSGESYPMDFYFNVFSGGATLTQKGTSLFWTLIMWEWDIICYKHAMLPVHLSIEAIHYCTLWVMQKGAAYILQ